MHRITLLLFVYIVSVNCQFGDEFVNPDPFPLPRTGLLGQGLYPYGQGLGGGAAINNQFGLGNNEFGQGRRGLGRGNQGLGLGQGSINQGLGLGGGIDQTSSLYGQNAGFASIDNGPFGGLPDSGSFAIEKPRRHRPHGERGERGPRPSEIRGSGRNIGEWPVDGTDSLGNSQFGQRNRFGPNPIQPGNSFETTGIIDTINPGTDGFGDSFGAHTGGRYGNNYGQGINRQLGFGGGIS